jgi:uncharacterized protein YjeT (DUF2065 family)
MRNDEITSEFLSGEAGDEASPETDSSRAEVTVPEPIENHASEVAGRGRAIRTPMTSRSTTASSLAVGLGCFSVALGLAELTAPRLMARAIGAVPDASACRTLRAFGLREIATGAAILAQPDRAGWLWSRVSGDLLDLSALRGARYASASDSRWRTAATWAVLGVTALDVLCAMKLGGHESDADSDAVQRDASAGRWRTIYKNTPLAMP